jgi:hypothetical protein
MGAIYINANHVVIWLGPDPMASTREVFISLLRDH